MQPRAPRQRRRATLVCHHGAWPLPTTPFGRGGGDLLACVLVRQCACRDLGIELPAVFRTAAVQRMLTNTLSTSTLASDVVVFGGFGPVEAVGYVCVDVLDVCVCVWLCVRMCCAVRARHDAEECMQPGLGVAISCSESTSTTQLPATASDPPRQVNPAARRSARSCHQHAS